MGDNYILKTVNFIILIFFYLSNGREISFQ